jgi:IS30 family transposase
METYTLITTKKERGISMTQSNSNTAAKHYQQLSQEERGEIQAFLECGRSMRWIANRLHRSPSTISREIKRGTVRQLDYDYLPFYSYFAESGQANHEKMRSHSHSKGLLEPCWLFFSMLHKALQQRPRVDSIDSFVHRFMRQHPEKRCPSTPTVYRYVDLGLLPIRNVDLPMKLRRREKSKRKHHDRMNKKILGTSIDERPDVINNRSRVGDWEGDLVKGKRTSNEPAIMTLTERVTRYEILVKIPDYHAKTCQQALQSVIDSYGSDFFQSITFDNGSEFSLLNQVKGTQLFFAHPYSPWERGSNENQNGLIRQYIPKGNSLHDYSETYIADIQNCLNNKLRKCLGYLSANEAMQLGKPITLQIH